MTSHKCDTGRYNYVQKVDSAIRSNQVAYLIPLPWLKWPFQLQRFSVGKCYQYRHNLNKLNLCSVGDSPGTSTILSEIFRGFLQSLLAYVRIALRLRHDRSLPNSFQFISHHVIQLKSSLNNLPKGIGMNICEVAFLRDMRQMFSGWTVQHPHFTVP